VDHLSSCTLRRASQIYERETLGTSFNLTQPLLRSAELEVRIGVHPRLLLLVMIGSDLRSGGQVWIDSSADCQFAAADADVLARIPSRTTICDQTTPRGYARSFATEIMQMVLVVSPILLRRKDLARSLKTSEGVLQ
jgi:hypothetical protein